MRRLITKAWEVRIHTVLYIYLYFYVFRIGAQHSPCTVTVWPQDGTSSQEWQHSNKLRLINKLNSLTFKVGRTFLNLFIYFSTIVCLLQWRFSKSHVQNLWDLWRARLSHISHSVNFETQTEEKRGGASGANGSYPALSYSPRSRMPPGISWKPLPGLRGTQSAWRETMERSDMRNRLRPCLGPQRWRVRGETLGVKRRLTGK